MNLPRWEYAIVAHHISRPLSGKQGIDETLRSFFRPHSHSIARTFLIFGGGTTSFKHLTYWGENLMQQSSPGEEHRGVSLECTFQKCHIPTKMARTLKQIFILVACRNFRSSTSISFPHYLSSSPTLRALRPTLVTHSSAQPQNRKD